MKYKVKVTVAPSDKERLQRQLPGKLGIWKNFQFFINEPIEEADFWVVCFQKLSAKQKHVELLLKTQCSLLGNQILFITFQEDF